MIRPIAKIAALVAVCAAMAFPAAAQAPNSFSWSGDVDTSATIFIHAHHAWVDNVVGKPVTNIDIDFNGELPHDTDSTVHLHDVQGRGTVQIIHQPTADNNYTAAVRISDPDPGRGHYHFVLDW